MKKALTALLIVALLLGLAGCKAPITVTNLDGSEETATAVKWDAQYIRAGEYREGEIYPKVHIVKTAQELNDHRAIKSLDACKEYDADFFAKNYLILVLLEEPSGSNRHKVESVAQTDDKKLSVFIDRIVPEVGTCDMAQWHIILELSRDVLVEDAKSVLVYLDDVLRWDGGQMADHPHAAAEIAQTVENPASGYCGNIQTTLYIDGKEYTFQFGNSVTLTDILVNLDYNPDKVCRCMAQYRADTEFGSNYQIHLDNGFVRCDKGQADLTQDQIDTIAEIIHWAKTTNCQYPIGGA